MFSNIFDSECLSECCFLVDMQPFVVQDLLSPPLCFWTLQQYVGLAYVQHFSSYRVGNKFLAIYNDQPVLYMELTILYSASAVTHKYNATKNRKFVAIANFEHQIGTEP